MHGGVSIDVLGISWDDHPISSQLLNVFFSKSVVKLYHSPAKTLRLLRISGFKEDS